MGIPFGFRPSTSHVYVHNRLPNEAHDTPTVASSSAATISTTATTAAHQDVIVSSLREKMPWVALRAAAIYPGATLAAQIKGGASFSDAGLHTLKKIWHMPDPRRGFGAYFGASTLSVAPATLTHPLAEKLKEFSMPHPDRTAIGISAVLVALATNLRNFAFVGGEHGLNKAKIFAPRAVLASFGRDTGTGAVYSMALHTAPEQSARQKVGSAFVYGAAAGAATAVPDTYAYMAARDEAIAFQRLLLLALRVAPVRAGNVGAGAALLALHGSLKKSE